MGLLEIVGSVLLVITSIIIVLVILAQHGKSNYLGGAIAGGAAETLFGKSKARSIDAKLGRFTRIIAIIFILLTLLVNFGSLVLKH